MIQAFLKKTRKSSNKQSNPSPKRMRKRTNHTLSQRLPWGLSDGELTCQGRRQGSTPGSERIPHLCGSWARGPQLSSLPSRAQEWQLLSHVPQLLKAEHPRAQAPRKSHCSEKPAPLQSERSPCSRQLEKTHSNGTQHRQK